MDREWFASLTRWQQAFFTLLHSGLWGTPPAPTCFPLTADEWQLVYDEACHQTVQGIVFDGLQQLPPSWVPPQALTLTWTATIASIIQSHRQCAQVVAETQALLAEAGVEPVLMKGLAVAECHEHPEHRVNGDIDWYIPSQERFALLPQFMADRGIDVERRSDNSLLLEYHGIEVELHDHLIDIMHPRRREKAEALILAEGFRQLQLSSGLTLQQPGPVTTLVMLNAHILKHTSTVGIGLRQFCDMARAYHALNGQYDNQSLVTYLRQLGLWSWSLVLHTFLTSHLGLSSECLPTPVPATSQNSRRLMDDVLRWGNFGQTEVRATVAQTIHNITRRLPFSLRYAPAETASMLVSLIKNRIKNKIT